jgi:multimeric flavodoxin WrbA
MKKGEKKSERTLAVLLGSPRRGGNSETLALRAVEGAEEAGFKTHVIRVTGLKIGGCIDCRRCWTSGSHCFLNDDMKEIYAVVDKAEAIIFASPLYFYSWSAQIKPAWDRLLPYFSKDSKVSLKGRKAILMATAGDTNASCFDGLKKSFELACEFAGIKIAAQILVPGVNEAGAIAEKTDALAEAFALGKSL